MDDNKLQQIKNDLTATLTEEIYKVLAPKLIAAKKQKEAPKLSRKGLQIQMDFNNNLLAMLEVAKEVKDPKKILDEVIEAIRKRNLELVLLDTNPEALEFQKEVQEWKDMLGDSSDVDPRTLALFSHMDKKQSFQYQTSSSRHERTRNHSSHTYESTRVEYNYRSNARCFRCNQRGHIASRCYQW